MVIIQKRNVLKCWISAIKQMNLDSVHLSGSTVCNQHQKLHGGWDECSEILDSDRLVVVISPAAVWGMCNCVNRAAAGWPEYNPWQQAGLSFVLSAVWGMCNCVNRAAAGRPEYNPWQQADLSFVLSAVWGMCNCVNRAAAGRPEYNPWQQADLSFVLSRVTTRVSWPAHLPRRQTLILRHSIRDGKPTLWRGTCTVGDMNKKSINGTVLLCG